MNIIISGTITEGSKVGTSIGFPTANIEIDPIISLQNGVYAVVITLDGYNYNGMANIGTRPTVSDDGRRFLEANIFGYNGKTYGSKMAVRLIEFIRPEVKFDTLEELKKAIENDKETVMSIL